MLVVKGFVFVNWLGLWIVFLLVEEGGLYNRVDIVSEFVLLLVLIGWVWKNWVMLWFLWVFFLDWCIDWVDW